VRRQGNVYRVDTRVVHQRLEVTVDTLNAEAFREQRPLSSELPRQAGEP